MITDKTKSAMMVIGSMLGSLLLITAIGLLAPPMKEMVEKGKEERSKLQECPIHWVTTREGLMIQYRIVKIEGEDYLITEIDNQKTICPKIKSGATSNN